MKRTSPQSKILDFDGQLNRDIARREGVQNWIDTPEDRKFFYGRNEWGEKINEKFRALGFYVENEVGSLKTSDLKMLHALSLPVGVLPTTAFRKALAQSKSAIELFSFLHLTGNHELSPTFIQGMDKEVIENLDWYEKLFERLEDAASKQILYSLVNFRASWDLTHLGKFRDRREHQYLEPFLDLGAEDVYYDVGAFTGDSYFAFLNFFGEFKASFLFEPNKTNFNLMRDNIDDNKRATLLNLGLSDFSEKLKISSEGSSSRLVNYGGELFEAAKLDDLDITPPSFIKVDIEGMEEKFLEGAFKTISVHRPKIAIAVYHNPQQLRNIVNMIDAAMPSSKFLLRHYTEGFSETILYALPVKR